MAVGRRKLRTGMTATAVAAAAMVALTASQAPGVEIGAPGPGAEEPATDGRTSADGNSPYHTELPPLDSPEIPDGKDRPGGSGPGRAGAGAAGIPATVLTAYRNAEKKLAAERPGCNLPWELLAAIGRVESGQARGGALDSDGNTLRPIRGPVLDGNGFALIKDTDGGAFDGDKRFDRAVGPMQFIPSTWASWGADGNDDGVSDPNNIHDAALAAGRYLCAGGRDLSRAADLERAILSYNRSREYLRTVLSWLEFYRKGTHEVPDGKGTLPDSPGAGNPSRPASPKPAGQRPDKPGATDSPGKPGKPTERPTTSPTGSTSPTATPSPTGTPTPTPSATDDPDEPEDPENPDEPEDPDDPQDPCDPEDPSEEESDAPQQPDPSPSGGDPDEGREDDGSGGGGGSTAGTDRAALLRRD
ncbi:lytic murein transglycosylase [Streptomyces sp. P38-E01]|uniref:Lytic murein transglycosylase n=1 Tax=Streptomyces tardus TaxID=2780544 RepID=A0A949N711_9ACTN|nr:lytic murein transglycosylase [Streptomyces tardus]MBU7599632.1 lytic murein transglycosylase [Streptomyces tardus]